LEIELPTFTFGTSNVDPAWVAKFPLAKVPTLETHTEPPVYLAESAAIAHFVADSGPAREQLLGSNPTERAYIQQWIFHAENEVTPQIMVGIRPKIGRAEYDPEAEAKAFAALDRIIAVAEKTLTEQKWLAGTEKVSMADLAMASALTWGLKIWLKKEWRAKWPKTLEWYERTISAEGVKEVFGEQVYLEE
jgi:elongation factor 1-gamma